MYQELARRLEPVALAELSTVRRELEKQRRQRPADDPGAAWAAWATPALFLAGPPLVLYRRADGMAPVPVRSETAPALGGMIRRVGDFVGRRAELRALLRDLRGGRRGVVLHGIGGIGKSSLAAQLVDQLGAQAGLVVPIVGHTRVDLVVEEIRQRLHAHCLRTGLGELLGRLGPTPLARRLLLGAAVYRHPVDRIGLVWQIAPIQHPPADPDRDQRIRATSELTIPTRRPGITWCTAGPPLP